MRIPNPFCHQAGGKAIPRNPASHGWRRRLSGLSPSKLFAIPEFDTETERLFWQERYPTLLMPMKSALALGACAFLIYILLDVHAGTLAIAEALIRLPIVLVLFGLLRYLQASRHAADRISSIAKLGAGLSATDLMVVLLIDANPDAYAESWPGLLPMYFFSYGQMFMSLRAAIGFGWMTALAMPLTGYWVGVESVALIPSILNLIIVNLFGLCTRCQLEAYSRKSFLEKRKAENSAEDKTRFLHQLSHNLRQPLQALSCYSSVLDAASAEQANMHLQPVVGKMGLVIDELNSAFNHVLDIANLESGKQIPLLTTLDINVLLSALENQYTPQATKRGLKLKVRLRSQPPYSVRSDASILNQIVGNLIDNAIKYTNSGWILVAVIHIGRGRLKLHVRDSGPGIADSMREHIFEEFFRSQRRQADDQTQGLGIGLAYVTVATKCLPDHRLQLYSKPQIGSDFQLYLPVVRVTPKPDCALPQQCRFAESFVLMVDDDPDVLDAMVKQLTVWGCLVQQASCMAEVLAVLADNLRTPDLLITDFYLGNRETALDVIAAVHADCGPIPTLILSARAIPDHEKAKWPGNIALLRKPAGAAILMETMAKAMGK